MGRGASGDVEKRKTVLLQLLKQHGPCKVSDVCRILSITPMQAYYVLTLLCNEGKVKRERVKNCYVYRVVTE